MNACVSEASNRGESLMNGSSPLRGLVVIIGLTWVPFPIWYALSPEGFNIVQNEPGMKVGFAFLNMLAKGAFIMYVIRIRADYQTRQKTMASIGYITADGQLQNNKGLGDLDAPGHDGDENMDKTTVLIIEEVLLTMGRSKDKAFVVDLLQSHLITSNGDILSLTKEYCREINLPWGLVLALKSKIRSSSVQADEEWSMHSSAKPKPNGLSFSAPHIAKNNRKIESVRRRQSERPDDFDMERMSEKASTASVGPAGPGGHNDDTQIAALLDSHQKNVNAQVDECRQFVMHSMDKIMNVLEERLTDANQPQHTHLNHMPRGTAKILPSTL
jgi:hypothetical protein